jgi:hypothetical protein
MLEVAVEEVRVMGNLVASVGDRDVLLLLSL